MIDKIPMFLNELSRCDYKNNCVNLYSNDSDASQKRSANLKAYLELIAHTSKSKTMLLGEAPGYKGCKNTGIAFTCEHTIKTHDFFQKGVFATISEHGCEKEHSASVVWSELSKANHFPLIWNIFPFHPHEPNNEYSNRTPSSSELKLGLIFTHKLINIFDINQVICIGKKSEKMMKLLTKDEHENLKTHYVRHPAKGGANLFRSKIGALLNDL